MSQGKRILLYGLTGIVFLGCFHFGLLLAGHKRLWNDEIYSQVSNVEGKTYSVLLLGQAKEGNNCPLFYVLQKAACDLAGYQTPDLWHQQDAFDRLFLRLNPVFFMSLTIACIFFYFSRFHSFLVGFYSLFITFSSLVIWLYWVEARPYALWIFLTTVQALFFLWVRDQKAISRKAWVWLTVIHFLLALTIVFGIAQIAIVSALLWVFKERRLKYYVLSAFLPISLALFYYVQAPKYQFWFHSTPEQLVRACFSRERFYILFIFIFFLGAYALKKKTGFPKAFPNQKLLEAGSCFLLTVLMLSAAFALLAILKWKASAPLHGFPVSDRYFVYLTPIGIISTTLLSLTVFRSLSGNRWIQILVLGGMGHLIIYRFIKEIPYIRAICASITA